MRKFLVVAVFAFAILGLLAPPVFAQAPTPKVTITGNVFEQVTSLATNIADGNMARTSDREWYGRTRFRPDFTFEVGRTKAVLGLEFDLVYGQTGTCGGGPGKNVSAAGTGVAAGAAAANPSCLGAHPGQAADSSLNTDVAGIVEVKWAYTEFDLTGKDSLMPFINLPTVARAGLQPFASLANYKILYATGDFAGVSGVSTFAPNLSTKLAYVMVEDENAGGNRGGNTGTAGAGTKLTRGNDFAIIASPEITPFKGLDLKPLYSYFHAEGTTSAAARRAAVDRHFVAGGASGANGTNSAASFGSASNPNGSPAFHEERHTVGADASWRSGPWGLDPSAYYQFGTRDYLSYTSTSGGSVTRVQADMSSVLVDIIGSFQTGPLLLELRGNYSTGNKARDNLAKRIRYFEPLDTDTGYYSLWANILALGIDSVGQGCGSNAGMCTNVGYDRYGRAQFGARATYSMTPALSFYAIVSPTWTAQKVDRDSGVAAGGARTVVSDQSFREGDSSYIGTETDIGMTWRFAPNVQYDVVGAWLSAGKALDNAEVINGVPTIRKASDGYLLATKLRFAF